MRELSQEKALSEVMQRREDELNRACQEPVTRDFHQPPPQKVHVTLTTHGFQARGIPFGTQPRTSFFAGSPALCPNFRHLIAPQCHRAGQTSSGEVPARSAPS